jgi:hypothetical protein
VIHSPLAESLGQQHGENRSLFRIAQTTVCATI